MTCDLIWFVFRLVYACCCCVVFLIWLVFEFAMLIWADNSVVIVFVYLICVMSLLSVLCGLVGLCVWLGLDLILVVLLE